LGVEPDALWEIQWLPGSGGRVRRVVVTRRALRWTVPVAVVVLGILLGIVGILPVGLHGVFARFTVDAAKEENRTLRERVADLNERADSLAVQVYGRLQRGRRLAWVVGAPEAVWGPSVAPPPLRETSPEVLGEWLQARGPQLAAVGDALAMAPANLPCPLSSLPTGVPVAPSRAVEISPFGVQTSAFTGKPESHHGCTIAAPDREPVLAAGAGRVAFAGTPREQRVNEWTRYGTTVVIDHSGGVWTVYSHLREATVRRGQSVRRGDRIGSVGQTGWTRVPALYFEVRWPFKGVSVPVDPALFCVTLPLANLDARLADPTAGLPDDYARLEHLGIR
jgi:murein DD-endopeptidase MepM/ murein hydrolase activator NlpD